MPLTRFIDLNWDSNNILKHPKSVNEIHTPVLLRFESMKGSGHIIVQHHSPIPFNPKNMHPFQPGRSLLTYAKANIPTCLKPSSHPHTMGVAFCRHNVVVGVSSEHLREIDDCHSTLGVGGVPVHQVSVGWVCTIGNGAVIHWLIQCALHKCIGEVGGVKSNSKVNISAIYMGGNTNLARLFCHLY